MEYMEFVYRPYPIVRLNKLTQLEIEKFVGSKRKINNGLKSLDYKLLGDEEALIEHSNDIILFSTIDEDESDSEIEAEKVRARSPSQDKNRNNNLKENGNADEHEQLGDRGVVDHCNKDKAKEEVEDEKFIPERPERTSEDMNHSKLVFVEHGISGKILSAIMTPQQKGNLEHVQKLCATNCYRCPICKYTCSMKYNLKRHFMIHLENNPFVCKFPGCTKKFDARSILEKHAKVHPSAPAICQKCGMCYSSPKLLLAHSCNIKYQVVKTQKQPDEIVVEMGKGNLTETITKTEDDLIHGKEESFTAAQEEHETHYNRRNEGRDKLGVINTHDIMMNDPVFIKVAKEHPDFAKLMNVTRCRLRRPKIRIHPSPKVLECEKCKAATFSHYMSLRKHQKTCAGYNETSSKYNSATVVGDSDNNSCEPSKLSILCETCGYQSTSPEDLRHHQQSSAHHVRIMNVAAGKHQCPLCGCFFDDSKALEVHHKKFHLAMLNFKCKTCDKSFATEEVLRNHESLHIKNVYYTCLNCGRRFKKEQNLWLHERKCANNLRPVCQSCGQDFFSIRGLRQHVFRVHSKQARLHIKAELFICLNCGRKCKDKVSLKIHKGQCVSNIQPTCPRCGKGFRTMHGMRIHVYQVHSKQASLSSAESRK